TRPSTLRGDRRRLRRLAGASRVSPRCTSGGPAVRADVYAGHVDAIVRWWDGVELWVTGLPFILQVVVVMVVLVPLAALVAIGLDIVVAKAFAAVKACALYGRGDDGAGRGRTAE